MTSQFAIRHTGIRQVPANTFLGNSTDAIAPAEAISIDDARTELDMQSDDSLDGNGATATPLKIATTHVNTWAAPQQYTPNSVAFAASLAISMGDGSGSGEHIVAAMTSDAELTITDGVEGRYVTINLQQDGTGGWAVTPNVSLHDSEGKLGNVATDPGAWSKVICQHLGGVFYVISVAPIGV